MEHDHDHEEEDVVEYCNCDPNERIERSTDDMRTWVCVDCGLDIL